MNYIEQHLAEAQAIRFFLETMSRDFASVLEELYDVDADGYTTESDRVIGGIYLPAPQFWSGQPSPTTDLFKDIGFAHGFIGPTAEAFVVGQAANAAIDVGFVWQMNQPFAASIVFGVAPQDEVEVDGRRLREEEILRYRASYYAGALAHCAFNKFFGRAECWGIRPQGRSSQQTQIETASDQYSLVAVSAFEFEIVTKQLFPPHGD